MVSAFFVLLTILIILINSQVIFYLKTATVNFGEKLENGLIYTVNSKKIKSDFMIVVLKRYRVEEKGKVALINSFLFFSWLNNMYKVLTISITAYILTVQLILKIFLYFITKFNIIIQTNY